MQQAKLWKYTFKASTTHSDYRQLWKIHIQKFRNSQWGRHLQTHIQVPRSCSICWMMQKLPISIIPSIALHKLIPRSHTSHLLQAHFCKHFQKQCVLCINGKNHCHAGAGHPWCGYAPVELLTHWQHTCNSIKTKIGFTAQPPTEPQLMIYTYMVSRLSMMVSYKAATEKMEPCIPQKLLQAYLWDCRGKNSTATR